MSFSTENAQAVVDAYGGVYPVNPDADADHRKCLAAALRKVSELVSPDLSKVGLNDWAQGFWTAQVLYKNELLDLAKSLEETQ